MPTVNLPEKSHDTIKIERKPLSERKPITENLPNVKPCYKHWNEFLSRAKKLKLQTRWSLHVDSCKAQAHFKCFVSPFTVPKYEIIVNETLEFTCFVFGWMIPDDNAIYKLFKRSLRNVTISILMHEIETYQMCEGVEKVSPDSMLLNHAVPTEVDLNFTASPIQLKCFVRHKHCLVLHNAKEVQCETCKTYISHKEKKERAKAKIANTPAKSKAPLSKTSKVRIALALQQER